MTMEIFILPGFGALDDVFGGHHVSEIQLAPHVEPLDDGARVDRGEESVEHRRDRAAHEQFAPFASPEWRRRLRADPR